MSFESVGRCVTIPSVPDQTRELLALLDGPSAERFARRLLWTVVLRRLLAAMLPTAIILLHFLA